MQDQIRTAHDTEAALARALHRQLDHEGVRFKAVFPYNRFDHETSTWWLSFTGAPAFSAAKLQVGPGSDARFEVGLVLEKGFENDTVRPALRMDNLWDWHSVGARMQQVAFAQLLERLSALNAVVRANFTMQDGVDERVELAFRAHPWERLDANRASRQSMPASAAKATSLQDLIARVDGAPDRAFWWCDLYISVPVHAATVGSNQRGDMNRLVQDALLPLIHLVWPRFVSEDSES